MTIAEKLEIITAGEVRGDLEKFIFLYGEKATKKLELEKVKDFSFWDNGKSVIIYSGRNVVFDCNYDYFYGLKRLTTCYDKNGLYYEFSN